MTYNLIISKEAPLALRRKIIKCVAHLHYFSFHLYFFPFALSFFLSSLLFFKKFLWSSSLQNSIINFLVILNPALKTLCLISQAGYQFSKNLKFTNVDKYESKNVCNIWSLFVVFVYARLLNCTFQMWVTAFLWNIYRKDADTSWPLLAWVWVVLCQEKLLQRLLLWTF